MRFLNPQLSFQETNQMRKLRQLNMVAALILTLGTCALAGTIDTPPVPPPPSVTDTGTIDTPPSAQRGAPATDPVVEIALNLVQSALSLF
jgi:hypothetical protein